ncbi:MAG: hypothetical protein A3D92_06705 [Bacteroidetes bacterium RIFCSPHIGHO2_02_FULL_44_7]|nr:MAG: hypothetical protein A3D92_06705 [Bacteroidetes bacterium RIFCSPHIGHO2_02_FULL_44_7]
MNSRLSYPNSLNLFLVTTFGLFLSLSAYSQDIDFYKIAEKANPFPSKWSFLPDGTVIKCSEISWPWDDRLCDVYPESAGEGVYRLYKTENDSVIAEELFDSYCQGDSESGFVRFFDEYGLPIYVESGFNMYVTQSFTLYDDGMAIVTIVQPSEYEVDTETKYTAPDEDSDALSTLYDDQMELLLSGLSKRIEGLQALLPTLENRADILEATQTIDSLKRIVQNSPEGRLKILRRAGQKEVDAGDFVRLTLMETPIHALPSLKSEILRSVAFHSQWVRLLELGKSEMLGDLGTHHWFKVGYWDDATEESKEGWVYGAFIDRGFYDE